MVRRRSLYKDKNDMSALRHHRDRNLGFSVSTEFYQTTPFFFTRESSQLNLVGQYKGSSIFLICNGPSLVSGDYDLSLLNKAGVMTYGLNNGPATFRPNFWSCVDDPQRFLKSIWLDPKIMKFIPHAHAEKPIFDNEEWEEVKEEGKKVLVGECPNCAFFHRNDKFEASRWLFEDKINWGNHGNFGGGRSVMLPALRICFLLGFRKVYLLGADFNMSEDYTYHFDEQRAKGAVNCNMKTYKKMKDEYFPSLRKYFDAEGFEVLNCNPDSNLDCFEKVPYLDAIAEATGKLGVVGSERTWGMYSKPADKEKWREEPEDAVKKHLDTLKNRDDVLKPEEPSVVVSQEPVVKETLPEPVQPEPVQPEQVQPEQVQPEQVQPEQVQQVVATPKIVPENLPETPQVIPRVVRAEETTASSASVVRTEVPIVEEIQPSPVAPQPAGLVPIVTERKLIKSLPCRT